jgi:3-phosphoshikimate 1-carboxyvinyltransferase
VVVPGSKSATARSLILAALADGPGTITGGLVARDTDLMIQALRALGVAIDPTGAQVDSRPAVARAASSPSPVGAVWRITPHSPFRPAASIDCGLAGTVLRFVPPLAALATGPTRFSGDPAASSRPVTPLLSGLVQLGAAVSGQALPFVVAGPARGGLATIDSSASSQFVSGLLLAAAQFPHGVDLRHDGGPIPSGPHIQMTLAALAARGVVVEAWARQSKRGLGRPVPQVPLSPPPVADGGAARPTAARWRVSPGPVRALDEVIEPDLTTAAVFLAAALVADGSVTIPGWPARTSQPGGQVPEVLTRFGGRWTLDQRGLTVTSDGQLRGGDFDLSQTSELTPVVAALAVLADRPTTIRGVAHIRGHETDRLAALAGDITALGGRADETADGLVIRPTRLTGGLWRTHGDHRLAHAGALIGLRLPGVELDDVTVVTKTMPDFVARWQGLLGGGQT